MSNSSINQYIDIPINERQQRCGMARVVEDNKVKYIHTGCTIDRKASFDDSMPGTGPFDQDNFKWEHENALLEKGYTYGYK